MKQLEIHDLFYIPELVERFEILRVIGKGSTGVVLHVIDRINDNTTCALKIYNPSRDFDDRSYSRFVNEIHVLRNITHKNIVRAYDQIKIGELLAYTMEYVEGTDLSLLLGKRKFSYSDIDAIMTQLLDAIEALHNHKILHRDIKLENMMLTAGDVLKLSDFGLVKHENQQRLTKAGILLGTAQYMPPEYIKHSLYEKRSEIYTVGLVLHELLAERRWLNEECGEKAVEYMLEKNFKIPLELPKETPEKYVKIIEIALSYYPDHRFQDAAQMREALHEENALLIIEAIKAKTPSKDFRDYLIIVLLILFFVLVAVIAYKMILEN
jgi:eukaryotic-like serine/threonine-protein kinase